MGYKKYKNNHVDKKQNSVIINRECDIKSEASSLDKLII